MQAAVDAALAHARRVEDGAVSSVYPALAGADPELLGVAAAPVAGAPVVAGDAAHPFALMSLSKVFVLAFVAETIGVARASDELGVEATGLRFDDPEAIDRGDGVTNPMVTPGAIATTSRLPGDGLDARWALLRERLSALAGTELVLDPVLHGQAGGANPRLEALVARLAAHGAIAGDPAEALELYVRQCCLQATVTQVAAMGAALAAARTPASRHAIALMAIAGMYETSGRWLAEVGIPAKNGLAGGVLAVVPGWGALAAFSPRVDAAGTSVPGRVAIRELSTRLGLDLLTGAPAAPLG